MSYRELIMIDIREMLRRRAAGQSARRVARETGFDRKTVGRYFEAAATLPLPSDREPTEEEIDTIAKRVQSRPVPEASEEWKQVAAHRARIEAWLGQKRPLKLTKIYTLLQRDHGSGGATTRSGASRSRSSAGVRRHRRCGCPTPIRGRWRRSTSA